MRKDTSPKKNPEEKTGNFLSRFDDPAMAAASMESRRFVAPGLSGAAQGRYYTRAIAYSACAGASISGCKSRQVPSNARTATMIPQSFGSRALWRAPSTGACGVGDYPTPDLSRRESGSRPASEKSVQFGPDGTVPVKNANYPRAPSSRRSGLVGPHTTQPIVNYKYMTSTPREGYFWLPTLGT